MESNEERRWALGGAIVDNGLSHPSLRIVDEAFRDLTAAVAAVQEQSANLRKFGAGRTGDPTFVLARVVPALERLSRVSSAVAAQMSERLK